MTEEYMTHPTLELLKAVGGLDNHEEQAFKLGRLSIGLEIVTVIRSIDGLELLDERTTATVVSVLETLLVDQGLAPAVTKIYNMLSAMRRPVFVPVFEQPDSEDASDAHEQDLELESDDLASLDAVLEGEGLRLRRIAELRQEHQSQDEDALATDDAIDLIEEPAEETSDE